MSESSPMQALFTIGRRVVAHGVDGDEVILNASGAVVTDGVTRLPVANIVCPVDGGTMMWDDGLQIDAPHSSQGASCVMGCGYTFNTELIPDEAPA